MNKISAGLVTLLMATTSCATTRDTIGEDRQVLSAVVARLCNNRSTGYGLLSSRTGTVDADFVPKTFDDSARQSLLSRNSRSRDLPEVNTCEKLWRTDEREIDSYLENSNYGGLPERWIAFYKRFMDAKGVTWLSLPGYSANHDVAVVQVAGACDYLCGSSFFWILKKVSGRWQVDSSLAGPSS